MKYQNAPNFSETETLTFTDLTLRRFSAAFSSKLEALKNQLVQRFTSEYSDVEPRLVGLAVDEAQSLAALTVFPHLLLPALAEEKVQGVRNWTRHQRAIYQQPALAHAA